MTVAELRRILEDAPQDMEIVLKPANTDYVEDICSNAPVKEVRAFWGDNYNAVVLKSIGQAGMI